MSTVQSQPITRSGPGKLTLPPLICNDAACRGGPKQLIRNEGHETLDANCQHQRETTHDSLARSTRGSEYDCYPYLSESIPKLDDRLTQKLSSKGRSPRWTPRPGIRAPTQPRNTFFRARDRAVVFASLESRVRHHTVLQSLIYDNKGLENPGAGHYLEHPFRITLQAVDRHRHVLGWSDLRTSYLRRYVQTNATHVLLPGIIGTSYT